MDDLAIGHRFKLGGDVFLAAFTGDDKESVEAFLRVRKHDRSIVAIRRTKTNNFGGLDRIERYSE